MKGFNLKSRVKDLTCVCFAKSKLRDPSVASNRRGLIITNVWRSLGIVSGPCFRVYGQTLTSRINNFGQKLHVALCYPTNKQIQVALFFVGVAMLALGAQRSALAQTWQDAAGEIPDDRIAQAMHTILTLIQGTFGALIAVCAGLGAILASAFGQYRAALSCLIVAVGSFILKNFIWMFFDMSNYENQMGED